MTEAEFRKEQQKAVIEPSALPVGVSPLETEPHLIDLKVRLEHTKLLPHSNSISVDAFFQRIFATGLAHTSGEPNAF